MLQWRDQVQLLIQGKVGTYNQGAALGTEVVGVGGSGWKISKRKRKG